MASSHVKVSTAQKWAPMSNVHNGPIQWRGSASMGFSKSRVEDEWLGETHSSASDSQYCHSWKIEKVTSGGWKLAKGGWLLNM